MPLYAHQAQIIFRAWTQAANGDTRVLEEVLASLPVKERTPNRVRDGICARVGADPKDFSDADDHAPLVGTVDLPGRTSGMASDLTPRAGYSALRARA